jgi:hypothetical protein
MKVNRTSIIISVVILLFLGLLMVVTVGSKDSFKHQLARRLGAFKAALPAAEQQAFDTGKYSEVTAYLQKQLDSYKAYTNTLAPEQRLNYVKADYKLVDKTRLQQVPKDLLAFYSKYYAVLDYECIQGFSVPETVEFFRKYFAENLEKMKKGQVVPDQN